MPASRSPQLERYLESLREVYRALPGKALAFAPAYMFDRSHNVTDPIKSLIGSAIEIVRAHVLASLIDRQALSSAQNEGELGLR